MPRPSSVMLAFGAAALSSTILISVAQPIAALPLTVAPDARGQAAAAGSPTLLERGSAAWANAEAKRTGKRQLVTDALSETETVYANPDGTTTTEFTALPTRVRSGSNAWVRPDADLIRRSEGTVGPKAAAVEFGFSGGGDVAPLVRHVQDGASVELFWPGPLPRPRLDGTKATYANVLPGVDLVLVASTVGYAQRFVVKTPEAARNPRLSRLRFSLRTDDAALVRKQGGIIEARAKDGSRVFVTPPATMWDAAGDSQPVPVGVSVSPNGVTLRPDLDFLRAADTVYPVTIDPDTSPGLWGLGMVSSGYPNQAYWQGGSDGVAKVGNCAGWYGCNGANAHRSYFQWNTASLSGKRILAAEVNALNIYSPSCAARPVEALATRPLASAGTTWNSKPGELVSLGVHNVAHGYNGSCQADWVGWNALAGFPLDGSGVRRADAEATIVLRAPLAQEGDSLLWKKFDRNPKLTVTYNTKPNSPQQVQVEGKACAVGANRPSVNPLQTSGAPRGVKLSARISDPDGGNVRAYYQWASMTGDLIWQRFSTTAASGSGLAVDVPVEHVEHGTTYKWRVLGNDFTEDGPVTQWCEVTIDRIRPGDAAVASVDGLYPECLFPDEETDDHCSHRGGAGRTGIFKFTGDSDVRSFEFTIEDEAGSLERGTVAAADGVAASARVTPPGEGSNRLLVWAVDAAGNRSAKPKTYWLKVGAGAGPVGLWHLDGLGESVAPDSTVNRRDAAIDRSANPWVHGRLGDALRFSGANGVAMGTSAPVRTDGSFTVSAWVKLTAADDNVGVALSQNGASNSNFQLFYGGSALGKKWVFGMRNSPTDANAIRVLSGPAIAGRWTHIAGVFNADSRTLRLYVDGVSQGVATFTGTPWNASGPLQVGRNQSAGSYINMFRGDVDEVRVYDRTLYAADVHDLAVVAPATLELRLPLDESDGGTGPDVSGHYRNVTMSGDHSWVRSKHDDPSADMGQALRLEGGYATTKSVVRTDSSYTVNAWVKLDSICDDPDDLCWDDAGTANQVVVEQRGTQANAFELSYDGSQKRWQVTGTGIAGAAGPVVTSVHKADANEWTLLTGVYNQAAGMLQLYVDGDFQNETAFVAGPSSGSFRIGSESHPISGAVDEVRAWAGARTEHQIRDSYADPAPVSDPLHTGQLTRFNAGSFHLVTTGAAPSAAHYDRALGFPVSVDTPGTRTIYSCRQGERDYFLSKDEACEGKTRLGVIGGFYDKPGQDALPVYRCWVPNSHHFASRDPACEGQTTEFLLGYTEPLWHLIRYVNSGSPYDQVSSAGYMPARYQAEWSLGIASVVDRGEETVPLRMCSDPADGRRFSSLEQGCEGGQFVTNLGFVWTSPPDGVVGTKLLFRCAAADGERFDNSVPFEDGLEPELDCGSAATFDRSLGYVIAPH